ncbi:hypothetical protein ACOMCU_08480 [Lysinibacillus sp. UGB7]|uniref:hypothetical protein n=1 Tax=Lysinibacillus sp. UGB7 TaxID=3411039 RepID=UPI003B819F5B
MFKISKLTMLSNDNQEYKYQFDYGINYFKGKNSSGKTEFYNFIDYMLGDSSRIDNKALYKENLKSAAIEFEYNNIKYEIKRTLYQEVNYFRYQEEDWGKPIGLAEYRSKLNSVFAINFSELNDIRQFAGENFTYRTFTLFNFLSEKSQGNLNDFFSKSSDIKYSIKLPIILNYIFNKNLKRILELKKQLKDLEEKVKLMESKINKFEFIRNSININLKKLNINLIYNGKNKENILVELMKVKRLEDTKKNYKKSKTISELESIFNNLNEQVKVYEKITEDNRKFEFENINKKKLVENLSHLVSEKVDYDYLVQPILKILNDLDKRISFNNYVVTSNTIKELKKQRDEIKNEITLNEAKLSTFDLTEKSKAIAIIEEYLNDDITYSIDELESLKKQIKEIKNSIKELQNNDDSVKIKDLSTSISDLYKSAFEVSDLVKSDNEFAGFRIDYYKKGNILQPKIFNKDEKIEKNKDEDNKGKKLENYYVGSMARHTLIQLCGYLGFLKMLISEEKYPLVPILVIDHISKPFDSTNRKAIGLILNEFYKNVSVKKVQMFLFDDEDYKDLALNPNTHENLIQSNKTGFNPFFNEDDLKGNN